MDVQGIKANTREQQAAPQASESNQDAASAFLVLMQQAGTRLATGNVADNVTDKFMATRDKAAQAAPERPEPNRDSAREPARAERAADAGRDRTDTQKARPAAERERDDNAARPARADAPQTDDAAPAQAADQASAPAQQQVAQAQPQAQPVLAAMAAAQNASAVAAPQTQTAPQEAADPEEQVVIPPAGTEVKGPAKPVKSADQARNAAQPQALAAGESVQTRSAGQKVEPKANNGQAAETGQKAETASQPATPQAQAAIQAQARDLSQQIGAERRTTVTVQTEAAPAPMPGLAPTIPGGVLAAQDVASQGQGGMQGNSGQADQQRATQAMLEAAGQNAGPKVAGAEMAAAAAPQQSFQQAMAGRAEATAEAKVQGVGQANAAAGPQAPAAPAPTQPAARPAAAQQASQPQAARPAPQSPVADQVAVQIQKAAKDGVDRITVTMRPEELGRVEVKLDVGADGRVTAMVTADNRDTLEMLQKDSRSLEKALQDAGLQTDSNSLSFNLRGDGRETHQSREQGRRGPMGRVATGLDITQDALSAPQPRTMARAGGVDIRV